ncbi:alpha/beta hydrolase [Acaryochloris marina]|uniref:alpha/beta hydrolase n=1 Tax=Acaryochloris marina TaxID=155978 RepID=UPI001BAF7F04|nr:alpha/beta hydrolase [Acaryochloris marina]QUY45466.1 alpha/beta hydrolase [Acaryochloris marina S15]
MAIFPKWLPKIGRWGVGLSLATVTVASTTSLFLSSSPANAAEKVVFTYKQFGQSLTIDELETFAQTGKASSKLKFFLNVSGQDPEAARQFMTKEVKVKLQTADRLLHILPGEYALFQAGQIFQTPSKKANLQAFRSAVILSLSDDNRISFLEFLQRYPTQEFVVDGFKLAKVADTIDGLIGSGEEAVEGTGPLAVAKDVLSSFICDCSQ